MVCRTCGDKGFKEAIGRRVSCPDCMRCDKCQGCGQVANSEDQEPWTVWQELPVGSDIAVVTGIVKPITCPVCNGAKRVLVPRPNFMRVGERAATEGVMRAWTRKCSMRAQAVLCASIRGCDGLPKADPSKSVVWKLRYEILNPSAEPEHDDPYKFSSFMGYKATLAEDTKTFLDDLDPYPFHFIQHMANAAHIVAVYHDVGEVRAFWRILYEHIIVEGMHARTEPDEDMVHRMRDR